MMKKFCFLVVLIMGLVFSLSACSKSIKTEVEEQVNELEDIKVEKNQPIDEYAEEEVDDYNDETEARSKQYNNVLDGSSGDDF